MSKISRPFLIAVNNVLTFGLIMNKLIKHMLAKRYVLTSMTEALIG